VAENSCTPHTEGSRVHGFSLSALAVSALTVAAPVCAVPPSYFDPAYTLPTHFDELLPPVGMLESSAPEPDDAQLSLLEKLDRDDLHITGFVASRNGPEAVDYRAYLEAAYKGQLGALTSLSSRAFYGTGTYDGVNAAGGTLPADVLESGNLAGSWIGTDWKIESQLSAGHTFSAGVEYRQPLDFKLLDWNSLLGRADTLPTAQPTRAMDIVTDNKVALSDDLAVKMRMRYEPGANASVSAIEPRVELLYKPEKASTLRVSFDQAANAPLAGKRDVHPWVSTEAESDRVRNYELTYEQSLSERSGMRLAAYRYDASGLPAQSADGSDAAQSASARIDTTGLEVGMERSTFSGMRGRVSYAWQETADWLAGASGTVEQRLTKVSLDVPIRAKSLTTSFELQHLDVVGSPIGPVIGPQEREFLIGNLTLASTAVSSTRITFGMHNLFDARDPTGAPPLSSVPTDGRSVRLDVTRRL
jgi:TonB dependent receptor-like, beta-barrel